MTRRILKYPLTRFGAGGEVEVHLPPNPVLRHVDAQRGDVVLWIESDVVFGESVVWTVHVVGTGQEFPDGRVFLGTVLIAGFVWHLFRDSS